MKNYRHGIPIPKFLLLIMRLSYLLFFLGVLQSYATSSYAQTTQLTIRENNIELGKLFNKIEAETDFYFFYNNDQINKHQKVNVDAKDLSITEILDMVLKDTDINYQIVNGKTIILNSKPASTPTPQQDRKQITGTVVDEKGEPVIGANVVEKGTTNGVITDMDGGFSLSVLENATLEISYIGYISKEMPVNNQTVFPITLVENLQQLDEVVVIAYGTTKRKDFTGSVSSLKLENSPISMVPNLNALETLKGSISGLDIGATNSSGGQPSMQMRGQNSISGNNDPLIVLDGMIYMGNINDINPNDISSFDILKDATSAAAYGSRSANGVIIITTKRGRQGKPIINLNVTGSMQEWHLKPELLTGDRWLSMVRDKNRYEDYNFLHSQQLINYNAGRAINWIDEATRTGWIQDYQLSVSGAGEKMNYYLSASYTDNKGLVRGDDFSRMTVLGKIDTDITDWLKIGVDASFTNADYSGKAADLASGIHLSPYDMMYRDEEKKLLEKYPNGQSEGVNPLWGVDSDNLDNQDKRNTLRTNAFLLFKVPWLKELTYRLNYAGSIYNREAGEFWHESFYAPIGPYDDESRYSISTQQNYLATANGYIDNEKTSSWVIDNILNYKDIFGKHSIDITAVATRDSWHYKYKQMTGSDFYSNGNTSLGLDGLHYAKTQKFNYNNVKRRNIGYFARLSYSFDDTYYLTGSYRRDGASVFGTQNKWGDFGAVGLAWRISNEAFMKQIKVLNDLKLKLSWGRNGNQGIDAYGTLSSVTAGSAGWMYYTFGNTGETAYGIRQSVLGNANLGWETTESWNTGFEAMLFDNRLSLNLDAYFSRTYDQIFTRSIPVMAGFTTMKSSMGEVRNKGVEISLSSVNIQNKDLKWTTSVTFWLNRNKLKHLYGEDLDGDGKEDDDIGNNLFIGHSINSVYGFKQDGIVQKSDVEYMEKNGVQAGTPKYVDIDGDGVITVDDRTIVANRDPRFKLNMSNTLSWKNWDLYAMFIGTFGGNGYFQTSNQAAYMAGGRGDYSAANNIYIPYWTEENPSNKYPAAWFLGDGRFIGLQSRAFVRLQDVTLSYTFKQPFIKNWGINNLKVFFTGKNLLTITGWDGGDPELSSHIVWGTWPVAMTLSLGANISF